MRILLTFFFFVFCFQITAQETTKSRKAAKAYREAKSALAVQEYNTAKLLLEESLLLDDRFIEAWIL